LLGALFVLSCRELLFLLKTGGRMQRLAPTRLIAGTLKDSVTQMEPIWRNLKGCDIQPSQAAAHPLDPDRIPDRVIDVVVDRMLKELTW
jgi:hypothetical protein